MTAAKELLGKFGDIKQLTIAECLSLSYQPPVSLIVCSWLISMGVIGVLAYCFGS